MTHEELTRIELGIASGDLVLLQTRHFKNLLIGQFNSGWYNCQLAHEGKLEASVSVHDSVNSVVENLSKIGYKATATVRGIK
jgi:hypothetical protein